METLSSTKHQSWLSWFLRGLLILSFLIVLARVVDLQIIRGAYFRKLSEGNRIRRVPIAAARGEILARGGEVLVGNKEVELSLVFDKNFGYQKINEKGNASEIITEPVRDYKLGNSFGHVSGYLGEVSEEELGKIKARCPDKGPRKLGELIGRSGLEEEYDCLLTGTEAEELIEVDSIGNKVRTLGRKEPIKGMNLKTTIDFGLQKKIAGLLSDKKGVGIVTDMKGEILAMYSSPPYDPNIFISDQPEEVSKVLKNKDQPLFNRAIGGLYHPGSIFKPIVAIASLETEAIDRDFVFEDNGVIAINTPYGNFSYTNWYFTQYGGTEGQIKLDRAIARSTDTFFYKIGEMTGVEKLIEWSSIFNLGNETGIDLPGEIGGLIPSPEWKLRVKGERWFLGNTYHMSIGQGDIALTPIGMNQAISAIASGGEYCKPHIVDSQELEKSMIKNPPAGRAGQRSKCGGLGINKGNIDLVKEGMVGACSSGGTGYTFFDFGEKHDGIKVACKTGTAEVGDGTNDTHAWFSVFAPSENPDIIATILVERGGEGSKVAGPIAREIFDYWFDRKD